MTTRSPSTLSRSAFGSDAHALAVIGIDTGEPTASIYWPDWIAQGDMVKSAMEGPYTVPDALERGELLCAPKAAMFDARIETVDTSGAYSEGFKSRRCLIPADGYFEWTKGEDGGKDPWLLQLPGAEPFSFAGIWARNDNLGITSCTIITAPATEQIAHIHGRMPVILEEEQYDAWLDTSVQGDDAKRILLDHHLDSQLQFLQVSRLVNSSRFEGMDTKKPLVNSL